MSCCRIDGSVTGRDRQHIIDSFNEGKEQNSRLDFTDYPLLSPLNRCNNSVSCTSAQYKVVHQCVLQSRSVKHSEVEHSNSAVQCSIV